MLGIGPHLPTSHMLHEREALVVFVFIVARKFFSHGLKFAYFLTMIYKMIALSVGNVF